MIDIGGAPLRFFPEVKEILASVNNLTL